MVTWILLGLGVYFLTLMVTASFHFAQSGLPTLAGGRDNLPPRGKYGGRATRAEINFKENLPFFLTFGVLAMVLDDVNMAQAVLGAQIFVISRIFYYIAYLVSIPFTRSVVYSINMTGLAMMLLAIL